jgi:hypothetical protein
MSGKVRPFGGRREEAMRGRLVRERTTVAFFHEQLVAAMNRQRVAASAFTEAYIVNLLASFLRGEGLPRREPGFTETPLALLYTRALAASGRERARRLRATADTALFVSGFFADSLPRGDSGLGYYALLGGRAYARLGHEHEGDGRVSTRVFTELAARFRQFVDLLNDISERTRLTGPSSLVKLYERWRETGSPRAAALLAAQGIVPAVGNETLLH